MFVKIFFCVLGIFFSHPLFGDNMPSGGSFILYKQLKAMDTDAFVAYGSQQGVYILAISYGQNSRANITLFDTTKDTLAREQITSWQAWIAAGAPAALHTTRFSIDLNSGAAVLPQNGPPDQTGIDSILCSIFTKNMAPLPQNRRKRIGAQPPIGAPDKRPFWNPPIIFEGKPQQAIQSKPYLLVWPKDGSSLQEIELIVYFADPVNNDTALPFRSLPTWIESEGRQILLRVIDSGALLSTES